MLETYFKIKDNCKILVYNFTQVLWNGIETIKGIKIHGNPKIIPDYPEGSIHVSSIEIELPYTPKDVQALGGLEVGFVKYQVMKYLNRLTETIRFSTRRYWIKMISEKDIDIYDIEFEENNSRGCN